MTTAIPVQIGGQPVLILKENVVRKTGEEALANNAVVAETIGEFMRSSLGPTGMDKLLVGSTGDLTITKSGVTILSEANIEHPIGKMFVELAKATDKNVGDGTTSAVIFASELIKGGFELVKNGVHPTIVAAGFHAASRVATSAAEKLALAISIEDSEMMEKVATSSMIPALALGRGAGIDILAKLAIDAAKSIAEKRGREYYLDTDQISIVKKVGGVLTDSRIVKGVIVEKEVHNPNMPRFLRNVKVALLDFGLEVKKTEISAEIELESTEDWSELKRQEKETVYSKISNIIDSGAQCVFCQKGVSDFAAERLARKGIMLVSRVKRSDMERLARSTGGIIVNDPVDIMPERMGKAELVEELTFGKDKIVILEGEEPATLSILLRSSNEDILDNYEKAVKRGISSIANIYEDARIVLGGGAIAAETAKSVDDAKLKQKGALLLVFEEYSKALERMVGTLVNNCGLNKIEYTAKIKALHHTKTGASFGVDALTKTIVDVRKVGIYEPLRVFEYWVKSATDLSSTILKVDDMIMSTKPAERR